MNEAELRQQLDALRAEVSDLRTRVRSQPPAGEPRGQLFTVVLVAALTLATTGVAQLVSFNSGAPAVASEVNANFQQLLGWLQAKVGPVSSAAVTATALDVNGATDTNSLTVSGNSSLATVSVSSVTVGSRLRPPFDGGPSSQGRAMVIDASANIMRISSGARVSCGAAERGEVEVIRWSGGRDLLCWCSLEGTSSYTWRCINPAP